MVATSQRPRPAKRAKNLLTAVADPDNLRLAVWKAAKGKRHSRAVLGYAENLDRNLLQLREQILDGAVSVGQYQCFKVYEPKERNICAPAFAEQALHHALMNVCHPFFEQKQIFDSYASRKGKGTYAAIGRARIFSRSDGWFMKLDLQKFFDSIHHDVLNAQLATLFKDEQLLHIFAQIIAAYHTSPQRGLPIGNLTSQYFANHYLTGLDHFIKEKLRIKAYVRYMDDMVLWHRDKGALSDVFNDIRHYVESRLLCALKPVQLNRTATGLPFLGYHIFPNHMHLLQKSKQRFIRKMVRVHQEYRSGEWPEARCQRCALSLLAFAGHADTELLRKNLLLRL